MNRELEDVLKQFQFISIINKNLFMCNNGIQILFNENVTIQQGSKLAMTPKDGCGSGRTSGLVHGPWV